MRACTPARLIIANSGFNGFFYSRNVTGHAEFFYFHYLKRSFPDQSIQKVLHSILKTEAVPVLPLNNASAPPSIICLFRVARISSADGVSAMYPFPCVRDEIRTCYSKFNMDYLMSLIVVQAVIESAVPCPYTSMLL